MIIAPVVGQVTGHAFCAIEEHFIRCACACCYCCCCCCPCVCICISICICIGGGAGIIGGGCCLLCPYTLVDIIIKPIPRLTVHTLLNPNIIIHASRTTLTPHSPMIKILGQITVHTLHPIKKPSNTSLLSRSNNRHNNSSLTLKTKQIQISARRATHTFIQSNVVDGVGAA